MERKKKKKKKKKVWAVEIAYHPLVGVLPNLYPNLSLLSERKSRNFSDKISHSLSRIDFSLSRINPFEKIMDLDTGKSTDKYPLCIFCHRIFFYNELLIRGKTIDWKT